MMSLLWIQDTDVFRNSNFSASGKTLKDGFSGRFFVIRNFLATKEFSKPVHSDFVSVRKLLITHSEL